MTTEPDLHRASLGDVETVPGVSKPDPILVLDGVRRAFGGVVAVDVEHLEIPRGCITALIGPNGAGKTTLFNVLTGFESADAGTWTLDGRPLQGLPPHRVARLGLVRTFQLTRALGRLSVLDNVALAARGQRGEGFLRAFWSPGWRAQERAVEQRASELLERVGLGRARDDFAATLSGGQRKLLELARVLMVDPSVVMLDEPMAGVNPALRHELLDDVRALRDAGRTVVFVEHDMDVVAAISDWVVVMAEGHVLAEAPPASVARDPAVIDAYLGSSRTERHEP